MATPTPFDYIPVDPEARSFFNGIKENPDDDTPRLIIADWLEERGNTADAARGEYLRLSVLRHRLSPDDPTYDLLKRREAELFTEYRWMWLGPLVDAAKWWTFERGMIQITIQAEKLTSPEVRAWTQTPAALWVDALALSELVSANRSELARCQLLAEINFLDLSANHNEQTIGILNLAVRAESLRFLTSLCLTRCRLSPIHVISLAGYIELPRLKILDLRNNQLYDAAARLLAESPNLKNLAELRLGHNRFTAEGMALLRQAFGDRVHF
jgi:uncharacterized protein (TIGR02996 family)